jgi:regulator of sirC expression with transglutaminase-like and TPR domain
MTSSPNPESDPSHAALAAEARQRFVALVRRPEEQIDLAEAALLIAAEEYPGLDIAAYLARIEDLAERVAVLARTEVIGHAARDPDEVALAALHHVLFEQERFEGEPIDEAYQPVYDPRNSFLNEVLDRKKGMPITLSLLYCEVARRAGLQAVGIALPGHFMAEFRGASFSTLVDPYNHGRRLRPEDRARLPQEYLVPATKKQILARMLTNLKEAYKRRGPLPKALAAIERLLILHPTLDQVRDRGLILAQMNLPGPAWFDLKLYARLATGAPDAQRTSEAADQLWRQMGRLN